MQGRTRSSLDEVYLMKDPIKLKEKYIQCLDDLQINWDYKMVTTNSPKVQKVIQENDILKQELSNYSKRLGNIEEILNSETDEEWRDIIEDPRI